MKNIKKTDLKAYQLLMAEQKRQQDFVNLIPSENYASKAVLEAIGSVLTNKYSEGYPNTRYYPGNENVDQIEILAQERARKLFGLDKKWFVNIQPLSGTPANLAVYFALLGPNDTALGMGLAHGGHLSHGHKISVSGKFFHFEHYGVSEKNNLLDYGAIEKLALKFKPKLIVVGHSAYPRFLDFKKLRQTANKSGSLLMVDMSHFAGLVAGKVHPSPFPYADIITTTTHKTLRGPRGAMIFSKNENISSLIRKAVFPGLQGGPHANQILGIAVALKEAISPGFKNYSKQVIANAKVLASELFNYGFQILTGGTDNHLMLINLNPLGLSGKQAEEMLYQSGIMCNRNAIPFDTRPPYDPSGLRLGTPAITTRGMKQKEMKQLAFWINQILIQKINPKIVKKQVLNFCKKFPLFYGR